MPKAKRAALDSTAVPLDHMPTTGGDRLIFRPELLDVVGLSFPTIWKHMRAGKFPRPRTIGGRVAWLSSEVQAWLAKLPEQKYLGDEP
jgi:predicted DNA-binding transcriptional regulator AlpA